MPVTLKDIAKACGVSRGTVDRALNNKPRISPKTKEKVLKKAKEMGYRPDLLARSLVKGKTMSIGVVVYDVRNRYFAQLLNSIETEAKKDGYFVYITLHEKDLEMEKRLINNLVDRRVDGIILCPVNKDKTFIEYIEQLPVPVVVIGNKLSLKIPHVGIDEKKAAIDAVEYIVEKGYEKIVFVCPSLTDKEDNIYSHLQRKKGFEFVKKQNPNIEFDIIDNYQYIDSVIKMINNNNKKLGIFCSGDIYALEIIKKLKNNNISIPQEVGIMGFDGIDVLDYVTPKLSTLYNPVSAIGEKSVKELLKIIDGKKVKKENLISYKIIEGDSL